MTTTDETRPITPETPRIETDVTTLWDITDVDSTVDKTRLDVSVQRLITQDAYVLVDDHADERCILRLRPDEARRLARALEIAADEADKLDRVTLDAACGTTQGTAD